MKNSTEKVLVLQGGESLGAYECRVYKMGGLNIAIATAAGFMFAFLLVVVNVYELRIF